MLIYKFNPLYFYFKCVWDLNKKFLIFFYFYLFYLCLPLPTTFVGGYSFSSWDYNTVSLISKLTSLGSGGAGVSITKDFTSILSSFSGSYWYSFSSCLICINTCHFLMSFSCSYITINLLSRF